eukprot:gene8861-9770_t
MGAGALSQIPMHIDKATFRQLSGGTINDAIFDANAEHGIMTRDRLIELSHMRDCYISCDSGAVDVYGRNIHERVRAIGAGLKAKGLLIWFNEEPITKDTVITHVCAGIDRSRSMLCFFTKSLFDRIMSAVPNEHCALEFNYTISKKHPDYIIPVVCEEQLLDPATWPGSIGLALGQASFLNFVDDNNWDAKIDDLYRRIVKISKAGENLFAVDGVKHVTLLSQTNKSKEEQQFFQWLARSTNIDESRRIIYCTSFVRAGVNNVFTLAKMMNAQPTFLTSIGLAEADADQIALAVRDLGLGYVPVREFDKALTIESVVYALRKASQQAEDPTLTENALACAARIAASNKIMPTVMSDAGIGEAVLKLMQHHLAHAPSMEQGCLTVFNMTVHNPDIGEKMGALNACDILPRTIRSHPNNLAVIHNGCCAIASLAVSSDNRQRFCYTGACDVVIKVVKNALQAPEVVAKCFLAANRLGEHHQENVSKLGLAGACDAIVAGLQQHYGDPQVVDQAFRLILILSVEPSNRTVLGQESCCKSFAQALGCQNDHADIVQAGCHAIASVIMGNAYNRSVFSKVGTCEIVRDSILKHPFNLGTLHGASRAVFALSAGTLENKHKFQGIQPILQQALAQNPQLPEPVKNDFKAALSKV